MKAYAIFELIGHANNSRNTDRQLALQSIVSKIPENVLTELKEYALGKNYRSILSLSGPSSEEEYASSIIKGITF